MHGPALQQPGTASVGELRSTGHVRGERQRALVADDERPVAAEDDVGLDELGTEVDGQLVAGDRVLGPVGSGTAVSDDDKDGEGGSLGELPATRSRACPSRNPHRMASR